MQYSFEDWFPLVEATISVGEKMITSPEQFDLASGHIVQLLKDASILIENGSHATATFLSITALEETAKVHMGIYRRATETLSRRKDPLYKHGHKHNLALGPTVTMGSRLQAAIGEDRMHYLINNAQSGGLVVLREASLYIEQKDSALNIPIVIVSASTSRELILLAIESFDDALVGYTSQSFLLGEETDKLFERRASG